MGEDGQHSLAACPSLDVAIKDFEKKFREKTKNAYAEQRKAIYLSFL